MSFSTVIFVLARHPQWYCSYYFLKIYSQVQERLQGEGLLEVWHDGALHLVCSAECSY